MTMAFLLFCMSVLVAGMLIHESLRTGTYHVVSPRMERFSKGLDRLLLFVPVLAAAVFTVLFLFVLKGRFYERLCHAALVLALWLLAARFYWFLISFSGQWKKMRGSFFCTDFILCLIGMLGAAFSAIFLTPLDRYSAAIHSILGRASILPGIILLAIFYAAAYLAARFPEDKRDTDGRDHLDRD